MDSLGEAYQDDPFEGHDPRRLLGGAALLVAGGLAVVGATFLVATAGEGGYGAKKAAGVLAGLGIPAMLLGVVVGLPSSRRTAAGVVLGVALTVVGVGLFWHAYPDAWLGADSLAFETAMAYFLGGAIALGSVFAAVASFRRRNDPHGTVTMEVVRQGETQTLEVSQDRYRQMVSDGGDADRLIRELDD